MPHCTPGKEVGDGRREQMRRAVAIERQRFGALRRHDPDERIALERMRQIDQAVVDHRREGSLGEARRNGGRDARAPGVPGGRARWSRPAE